MSNADNSPEQTKQPCETKAPPSSPRFTGAIGYIKRKFQERRTHRKAQTPEQQAAHSTAVATWWIAAFTIVLAFVGAFTLYEVISGGTDTHDLAEAAKKQAAASIQQVGFTAALVMTAKDQADRTKDLAERMKDQADRTKTIAEQAVVQANATRKLADSTLAASRAWVGVQATGFGFTKDKNFPSARVVLEDTGNSPAFGVSGWRCVEIRNDGPPLQGGRLQQSATAICLSISAGTLGKGVPVTMNAFIPEAAPAGFSADTEGIGPHFYYWGVVTFRIYPDDGKIHFASFCLKNGGDQLSACREGGYEAN